MALRRRPHFLQILFHNHIIIYDYEMKSKTRQAALADAAAFSSLQLDEAMVRTPAQIRTGILGDHALGCWEALSRRPERNGRVVLDRSAANLGRLPPREHPASQGRPQRNV